MANFQVREHVHDKHSKLSDGGQCRVDPDDRKCINREHGEDFGEAVRVGESDLNSDDHDQKNDDGLKKYHRGSVEQLAFQLVVIIVVDLALKLSAPLVLCAIYLDLPNTRNALIGDDRLFRQCDGDFIAESVGLGTQHLDDKTVNDADSNDANRCLPGNTKQQNKKHHDLDCLVNNIRDEF